MITNQPYTQLFSETLETGLRLARISLDSTERLFKLNLDTGKQLLEQASERAAQLANIKDVQDVLGQRGHVTEGALESALAYSRNLYDVVSQNQSEIGKLLEEQVTAFNKQLVANMENLSKSTPAGSDFAVAAAKSSIAAAAAAVDSMTKAAKQVADFTDTSVKAATTATVDAVKTAAAASKRN